MNEAQAVCGHIKQVKRAEVTNYIAEADTLKCYKDHNCVFPTMCLECSIVGCGDLGSNNNNHSCISEHMEGKGHSMSLQMGTGQVSCGSCNIPSLRSFVIGYTGPDQASLNKCRIFNEYIVKCWAERQTSTKKLTKDQQEKLFGLVNLKNTCYFNSVLQSLYVTNLQKVYSNLSIGPVNKIKYEPIDKEVEYFYDDVLEKSQSEDWHVVSHNKRTKSSIKPFRATKVVDREINIQFQKFLKDAVHSGGVYNAVKLFQCLGYIEPMLNDSTKQHDAQECLRILLDALSEGELLFLDLHMDRYRKIEKCLGPQKLSIIDRMFGFYLASKVVCLKCEKISWTIDLALDLQVELHKSELKKDELQSQRSIKDEGPIQTNSLRYPFHVRYPECSKPIPQLIESFFREERLTKDNYYNCDSCKSSNAVKRFYLLETGQYLTIVIKRFKGLNKDGTHVPFEQEIDIQAVTLQYIDPECPVMQRSKYRLSSVIIHEGGSANQGHYICCALIEDCWVLFNDTKVTQINWSKVSKMQAYILIYRAL